MIIFIIIISVYLNVSLMVNSRNSQCSVEPYISTRKFYKVKHCHRSNLNIISMINVKSLDHCIQHTKDHRGLAFNFHSNTKKQYSINCQVLGCPEQQLNSSTFVNDTSYDYYSLFGDFENLNSLSIRCIKFIGLFSVSETKLNYTEAIHKCQSMNGDLADITTETRSMAISSLINEKLQNWYKIAYVGLDDLQRERHFITSFGKSLNCAKYRAWAPGQPRSSNKHQDCVAIDSINTWKVINCKEKLHFVCEFYPTQPIIFKKNFKESQCYKIKD